MARPNLAPILAAALAALAAAGCSRTSGGHAAAAGKAPAPVGL